MTPHRQVRRGRATPSTAGRDADLGGLTPAGAVLGFAEASARVQSVPDAETAKQWENDLCCTATPIPMAVLRLATGGCTVPYVQPVKRAAAAKSSASRLIDDPGRGCLYVPRGAPLSATPQRR